MSKKIASIICGIFLLATDFAYASLCETPDPEEDVKNYETIFVAFVTEGHFVEAEEAESCGWIEGSFELEEALKGIPDSVAVIRKRLRNCRSGILNGVSDSFPIGKYILVKTNSEVAEFDGCEREWDDFKPDCYVDAIQRLLDIDAIDSELREWCIADENSGGALSEAKSISKYVTTLENMLKVNDERIKSYRADAMYLENERPALVKEIQELKEQLEDPEPAGE